MTNTLFEVSPSGLPPRLLAMHQRHGRVEGSCGDCAHFLETGSERRVYFKCVRYGVSRSTASDWRQRWPACGLFLTQATKGAR